MKLNGASDRWLAAGRAGWVIITLVVIAVNAAGLPIVFNSLRSGCSEAACFSPLNNLQIQQLQGLGFSTTSFAVGYCAILVLVAAIYILTAGFLILRPSAGWFGLLSAYTLVLFGGITILETSSAASMAYPGLWYPITILMILGDLLLPLFVAVFPDGRINPRGIIGVLAVWIVLRVPHYISPNSPLDMDVWPIWIQLPIWVGFISSLAGVQIYRYRRLYGPVLRQQTKWVVYGLTIALGGLIAERLIVILAGSSSQEAGISTPIGNMVVYMLMVLIPLSIAIAIMRYKLWDIDLLINRTLVYVPLTAILAGLYSASITLFQKIFIAASGQTSDAALVLATLVLAATFTPIKNGLQQSVDRRFKEPAEPLKDLIALDNRVRSVTEVLDVQLLTKHLLDTSAATFQASGGLVYLEQEGQKVVVHATPGWRDEDKEIDLPLEWNGRILARLALGKRESGIEYGPHELEVLQETANRIARVIAGFGTVLDGPAKGTKRRVPFPRVKLP